MKYIFMLCVCIVCLAGCSPEKISYQKTPIEKDNTVVICKDIRRFVQAGTHPTKETCAPVGHGLQFGNAGGIISAQHIIQNISQNYYIEKKGVYYPIINTWFHESYDIVVFRIQNTEPGNTLQYVLPSDKQLHSYYKFNEPYTILYGELVDYDEYTFTHTLPIESGRSGSPVYDTNYHALGIHTAYDISKKTGTSIRFHTELIRRIESLDFS